jgi:hypothetical protein
MTESGWLKGTAGDRMFTAVRDRLSPRKWVLLACGVAREDVRDLANEGYGRLIDGIQTSVERSLSDDEIDRLHALIPEQFLYLFDPTGGRGRQLLRSPTELGQLLIELHDGGLWPAHPGQSVIYATLLREQLGNPFRPYTFDPHWRTETVIALATGIEGERTFDRMPILADALEEAGCDERPMLDHLRGPGPHAVGCWVLDLILDREPELFALPPLVPTPPRMKLGPFTPPPENMA